MPVISADELREVQPEEHDHEVGEYLNARRDELNEVLQTHAETLKAGQPIMYVPTERHTDYWRIAQRALKAELEAVGYRAFLAPRTSTLLDDNDLRIELGRPAFATGLPVLSGSESERHEKLVNGEPVDDEGRKVVEVQIVDGEAKNARVHDKQAERTASDNEFAANEPAVVQNKNEDGNYGGDPVEGFDINGEPNDGEPTVSKRGRRG